MASDGDYSEEDINLLKLKKAILYFRHRIMSRRCLNSLTPIINSKSVWKSQTLKFLGDFYFSIEQYKKAKEQYTLLLEEENDNISKSEIERKIKFIDNG